MSPIKRFLRRIPAMRWCALQYVQRERKKQRDQGWVYTQSILITVANMMISWAGIELMLTHLVIWHHVKSQIRPDKGLPRMLTYQLDYMKKSIEKDSCFDDITTAKLSDIRERITRLNEFRISLIHGVLHQRNRRTTQWYTHSVKINGLSWCFVHNAYSDQEIRETCKEIAELGHEMSPFIAAIVGIPHPANP